MRSVEYKIKHLFTIFLSILVVGCMININYLDVEATNTIEEIIINDFDTETDTNYIVYEGDWRSGTGVDNLYNGDEHWAENSNWQEGLEPYYIIRFYGERIQLYGNKAPRLGEFKVYIDGEYQETASAYNSERITQQLVYESPTLENKEHTIKVQGVYNSGNVHFDYAKVFLNNNQEISKVLIEAEGFKKGSSDEAIISFKDLTNSGNYLAAELKLTYDARFLQYDSISSNQEDVIVKSKDAGNGVLHIVLSSKSKITSDLKISVKMTGKEVTEKTKLAVTLSKLSDSIGTITNTDLSDVEVAVIANEGEVINKVALSIAIDMAKNVTQEQLNKVVPDVANEFKAALENAETVFAKNNASQEEVDKAFDRLARVMQMLEFYKGDKASLQKMMDQIANLTASDFTDSSWSALQAVLPRVNEVLANENAMQPETDEVYGQLVKAFINLRLKPNKDLLEELINQANRLNKANYTAASWQLVEKELNKANNVYNDPEATEIEVNDAKNGLIRAIAGLVENKVANNQSVKPGDTAVNTAKTGDGISTMFPIAGLLISVVIIYGSKKRNKLDN